MSMLKLFVKVYIFNTDCLSVDTYSRAVLVSVFCYIYVQCEILLSYYWVPNQREFPQEQGV